MSLFTSVVTNGGNIRWGNCWMTRDSTFPSGGTREQALRVISIFSEALETIHAIDCGPVIVYTGTGWINGQSSWILNIIKWYFNNNNNNKLEFLNLIYVVRCCLVDTSNPMDMRRGIESRSRFGRSMSVQ